MIKIWENNGTEEIGLVTPIPVAVVELGLGAIESHSYLTGVPAAELRRHLSNIYAICNS